MVQLNPLPSKRSLQVQVKFPIVSVHSLNSTGRLLKAIHGNGFLDGLSDFLLIR